MWQVYFDEKTSVCVPAPSADAAKMQAQCSAWLITGKWLPVLKVSEIPRTDNSNELFREGVPLARC